MSGELDGGVEMRGVRKPPAKRQAPWWDHGPVTSSPESGIIAAQVAASGRHRQLRVIIMNRQPSLAGDCGPNSDLAEGRRPAQALG